MIIEQKAQQKVPAAGNILSAICAFIRMFTGVQARWMGVEPAPVQRIYFANHTSHADCMVLLSVLPRDIRDAVRPAAAADYWLTKPIRRWFAQRVLNIVPVERTKLTKANNPITRLVEALDQGNSLIVFPEGSRNQLSALGDFKPGLYHLSKARPDVELIPTYIDNANRILPKGEFIPIPLLCNVTFGQPIHFESNESKSDFLKRAHQAVERCAS